MFKGAVLVVVGVMTANVLACGTGGSTGKATSTVAATTAPPTAATAAATASGTGTTLTLGSLKFNNKGTTSVAGKSELAVAIDGFAFSPTFVSGTPGQKISVTISNDSATTHNISLKEQSVDKDMASKSKTTVDMTIPASGVLLFYCKFHTSSGMNGELLSGSAQPQAVGTPAAAGGTDYGY